MIFNIYTKSKFVAFDRTKLDTNIYTFKPLENILSKISLN